MGLQRISFQEYCDIDAINISTLLAIGKSPKHFRHRRGTPRKDSKVFQLGRAIHTAVLEPIQFFRDYVVSPYDAFRSTEAKGWKATQELEGKTILMPGDLEKVERIRDAVMAHQTARELLSGGMHEATVVWDCPRFGFRCKARLDYIRPGHSITDIKTSGQVEPHLFARSAARLAYHVRLAWYVDGTYHATGEHLPAYIVAVETEPPYDVVPYLMPEDALDAGRLRHGQLRQAFSECHSSGHWPGICPEGHLDLVLPQWALGPEEEETQTITIGGVPLEF